MFQPTSLQDTPVGVSKFIWRPPTNGFWSIFLLPGSRNGRSSFKHTHMKTKTGRWNHRDPSKKTTPGPYWWCPQSTAVLRTAACTKAFARDPRILHKPSTRQLSAPKRDRSLSGSSTPLSVRRSVGGVVQRGRREDGRPGTLNQPVKKRVQRGIGRESLKSFHLNQNSTRNVVHHTLGLVSFNADIHQLCAGSFQCGWQKPGLGPIRRV